MVMAGCADSATEPTMAGAVKMPTSVSAVVAAAEICEDITFDLAGLQHGTLVGAGTVSVFGAPLTFSAERSVGDGTFVPGELRVLDPFSPLGPDDDLRHTSVGSGDCAACESNMLVINDPNDGTAAAPSDAQWGGRINITGFPAGSYITQFQLADHENPGESDAQLRVNGGANVAAVGQPNGVNSIITVGTTSQPVITTGVQFILGNAPTQQGSEAIDNIRVCTNLPDDVCDFYTFGGFVLLPNNISYGGNAGFASSGFAFGSLNFKNHTNGDHIHVWNVTDYGHPEDGPLSQFEDSRLAFGMASVNGGPANVPVEWRFVDLGEPAKKNGDAVYLKVGNTVLIPEQVVIGGNIQMHAKCKKAPKAEKH
jgi:hypothetical protein